jgi:protein unc-45
LFFGHSQDQSEFVALRVTALVQEGVVSALVAVSKVESKSIRELIARILNVIAENKDHRGAMVQQGGAKALLALALEGTEKGRPRKTKFRQISNSF